MLVFLGIMLLAIAVMLGIMGYQQYRRRYFVAAGFSIVIAVVLGIAGVWAAFIGL